MSGAFDVSQADHYFTPDAPQFWRWAEPGCTEIEGAWEEAGLILFREELAQILAELQPQGWPQLSSLLLLCAATRDDWSVAQTRLWVLLRRDHPEREAFVRELMERLQRIARLPKRLREPTAAKIQLARLVFEGSRPVLPAEDAAVALRYLQSIIPYRDPASWNMPADGSGGAAYFANKSRSLRVGLRSVSKAALESRLQTGLDQEIVPPAIALPPAAATFGGRLAQWSIDPELYGVARIARQLVSVLSWPRPMSQPDEIPLGGVSDLTTSGELDRLLLSELAHDDDTLAVRIALKEALYVRREVPVQRTARQRAILVDTSLRMWGRPRVFGAAVALALSAAQDDEPELTVSVDVSDLSAWKSVDVATRAGTLELLSCLSPQLHPGHAVAGWAQHGLTEDMPCDPVLITTAQTLADPEFQRSLEQLPTDLYAALVDGDGRWELRRHSAHGWRVMRTAQLDLDDLLKPPAQTRTLSLTTREPDRYPAILRTDPFPLRLTQSLDPGQLWMVSQNRVLSLASAGRVMLWDDPKKAARQLGIELPTGRVEAFRHSSKTYYLNDRLIGDSVPDTLTTAIVRGKSWTLLSVDLDSGKCAPLPFQTTLTPSDQATKALLVQECAFLISRSSIQAFSHQSGELLAEMPVDRRQPLQCVGHRYLKNHQGRWTRLSFDGQIHLNPVTEHAQSVILFEPPAGISEDESICLPCFRGTKLGSQAIPTYQESSIQAVCQRGSLLMLSGIFSSLNGTGYRSSAVVAAWDLAAPEWRWNVHYTTSFDEAERQIARNRVQVRPNLRHKFSAILRGPHNVFLQSSKQALWQLQYDMDRNRLRLVYVPKVTDTLNRTPFHRLDWPGHSIPFRIAHLPNGNTVWLDGRGLMHLMPARSDQPEMTLVLDENGVSGWMSDGRVFGDSYYFDDHQPQASVGEVVHQLLTPFFEVTP